MTRLGSSRWPCWTSCPVARCPCRCPCCCLGRYIALTELKSALAHHEDNSVETYTVTLPKLDPASVRVPFKRERERERETGA